MSKKRRAERVFIITIVVAFIVSSLSVTGLVLWDLTRDKKDPVQNTEDIQQQLEQQQKEQQMQNQPLEGYNAEPFNKASVDKLKVEVLVEGAGKKADESSTVKANYFGWTSDGSIFDSSNRGGTAQPVEFPLNGVIKGWTQGLSGISEGSTVKLIIPAELAYGEAGSPPVIGSNEPLAFIVELKEVK
jgi:FKBP-type peptidyl-prolyl cis-trans isomerase